jgi:hypothetical protein
VKISGTTPEDRILQRKNEDISQFPKEFGSKKTRRDSSIVDEICITWYNVYMFFFGIMRVGVRDKLITRCLLVMLVEQDGAPTAKRRFYHSLVLVVGVHRFDWRRLRLETQDCGGLKAPKHRGIVIFI